MLGVSEHRSRAWPTSARDGPKECNASTLPPRCWSKLVDVSVIALQVAQLCKINLAYKAIRHFSNLISGRLQTVSADTNPRYYKLISIFARKTGILIVLNTFFNENEPVVCNPEEALDCFLRTNMDVLVLGNILIQRNAN